MFKWTDGSHCKKSYKNSSCKPTSDPIFLNKKEISYITPPREEFTNNVNPFITTNYIDNICMQDKYLRPKDSNKGLIPKDKLFENYNK